MDALLGWGRGAGADVGFLVAATRYRKIVACGGRGESSWLRPHVMLLVEGYADGNLPYAWNLNL